MYVCMYVCSMYLYLMIRAWNGKQVTTIDEDDRQEALGREPGNAAEGVEEVDDDSDDGRKKAIDKVLDLVNLSF